PLAGPAQVVVWIGRLRGPSAGVGKLLLASGSERIGMRLVAVRRAQVASMVPQDAVSLGAAAEGGVNRLDILNDRRISRAGVLEIHRPLDRRIVVVLHADAARAQAALGVGPGQGVLVPLLIQLLRLALQLPLAQELRRRPPAVLE